MKTLVIPNGVDGLPRRRRLLAIATMALAVSMTGLGVNMINVALPAIARSLQVSPADSIWLVTAHQMALAVALWPLASLGEVHGYRRVYLGGLALYCAASLALLLSHSFEGLVAWRAVQGLGAAGVLSVNIAILRFVYPRALLGRGIGINAFIAATSATAGPPVASLLLAHMEWRGLFAINIPIGCAALIVGWFAIPQTPLAQRRFDGLAALLSACTVGSFLVAASNLAHGAKPATLALAVAACIAFGWPHVRRERGQATPLWPVDLMRIAHFRLSVFTSVSAFAAQMLAFLIIPFLLEAHSDFDNSSIGLLMAPWPAATTVTAIVAGRLSDRYSPGVIGSIGLLVLSLGLGSFAWLPHTVDGLDMAWRMVLCGAGFGLFQSPNNRVLMSAAPPARSGTASGTLGTARVVGQSLGAALAAQGLHASLPQQPHWQLSVAMLAGAAIALVAAFVSALRRSPALR